MPEALISRQEPAQTEGEKLMPARALNGSTVLQPLSNEEDFSVVRDAGSDSVIIKCDTRHGVGESVCDSYRDCRPKWLAKFLKLFGDRLD